MQSITLKHMKLGDAVGLYTKTHTVLCAATTEAHLSTSPTRETPFSYQPMQLPREQGTARQTRLDRSPCRHVVRPGQLAAWREDGESSKMVREAIDLLLRARETISSDEHAIKLAAELKLQEEKRAWTLEEQVLKAEIQR